jgi:hypothetical protein
MDESSISVGLARFGTKTLEFSAQRPIKTIEISKKIYKNLLLRWVKIKSIDGLYDDYRKNKQMGYFEPAFQFSQNESGLCVFLVSQQ